MTTTISKHLNDDQKSAPPRTLDDHILYIPSIVLIDLQSLPRFQETLLSTSEVQTEANAATDLPTVRIEPAGVEVVCPPGEPVMRAVQRIELRWPTVCNGTASCGACYVRITQSTTPPEEPDERERKGLKLMPEFMRADGLRLACRLVPKGPMVVVRVNAAVPPTHK
jgi:ferredoxin